MLKLSEITHLYMIYAQLIGNCIVLRKDMDKSLMLDQEIHIK